MGRTKKGKVDKNMKKIFGLFLPVLMLSFAAAQAQNNLPAAVAKYGTADQIIVNGKIVSMDDTGMNTNPGRIYQAMALKGTRIMALGTNQEIRALGDRNTKVIDVGGMTVIPGIIDTHAHLFGDRQTAEQLGIRSPDEGVSVQVAAGRDVETTRMIVEDAIRETVATLPPGDWVNMGIAANPDEGITSSRVLSWGTRGVLTNRERLDRAAPENPVLVRFGSRYAINSTAWEVAEEFLPGFGEYEGQEIADVENSQDLGLVGVGANTAITWDIWYRNQPRFLLTEMIRRDWEAAAAHGVTAFGSSLRHPRIIDAATELHRQGTAPIRFMMLFETHRRPAAPDAIRQMYRMVGNFTGIGDDMMWFGGVGSELWDSSFPMVCLGPDVPASPQIKIREKCPKPGEMYWDVLQNALEAGWRLAGVHGVGSHGVRLYIQMIEAAMANTGMTVEDIRNLRITTEHAEAMGAVPDVIAKLKEYGIIVSANPPRMVRESTYIQDYGPAVEPFLQPVKTWLNMGVNVVGQFEGYESIGTNFKRYITREVNGRKLLPEEALDRVIVLKMWTTWASRYMLKENNIGTLEEGKLADFLVIDEDFFSIDPEEIPHIFPQMTVVGGTIRYLGRDFASKLGMEPVGYQFPAGHHPWGGD